MEYIVNENETGLASVQLSGQFTFADTQAFKSILDIVISEQAKAISLDFSDVTFIDSAGMGMLLLLRDECQLRNIPLSIHSVYGQVEKIFYISKFDQLFSLK